MLQQTIAHFVAREDEAPIFRVWTGAGVLPVAGQNQDISDFRALIAAPFLYEKDLLFLEDDIEPCRNALQYMKSWEGPTAVAPMRMMTSFYNPYRKVGLNEGFIFSQAFKLPWVMVEAMRGEPFPPPHPKLQRDGIDQVVHRYLARWRLPFYQHRSLVQHVGEVSTWTPSTLSGNGRRSIDWPGPNVDALTFAWGGK